MARKKKGRKSRHGATAPAPPKSPTSPTSAEAQAKIAAHGKDQRRKSLIGYAVLAAVIAGGTWYWWQFSQSETQFMTLVEEGQPRFTGIAKRPDLGRTHLAAGRSAGYRDRFPTSGPHDLKWATAGFHDEVQRAEQLVHALEHGNIVIYYDTPEAEALAAVRSWSGMFKGQWSGVLATPMPGLGKTIVLTAWRRVLKQETFDAAIAAAFVDTYRGRGPEHPVR